MNKLYADRNGVPIDGAKQDRATRAVDKLIKRDRQSKERSKEILNYYTNKQNGLK